MTDPAKTPAGPDDERRVVLLALQAFMASIGSANDAEDHGYLSEAERIRTESCAAVRDLIAEHPFLEELLPRLLWELDSGHILGFGWAEIGREAGAFLEENASLEPPGNGATRAQCAVCSSLADQEYAFQKYRSEESNTYLPAAVEAQAYLQRSSVEALWAAFCNARPDLAGPDTPYEAWHFCDNESDANELAALVLAGRKRATTGDLWSYEVEQEELPQAGDLSVITDWAGNAVCVIQTTAVEVVPFDAVTEEFAATEGEGDGSLKYWREVHEAVYSRRLPDIGRVFEPDMPVVCECFEVVYRGAEAGAEGWAGQ